MRIEWLYEAQREYADLLLYYKYQIGQPYAKRFSEKIMSTVSGLENFPEMGVLKQDTPMGKHGFRPLFIGQYVCIYRIEQDTVFIYHLTDARKNYIYHIFGIE